MGRNIRTKKNNFMGIIITIIVIIIGTIFYNKYNFNNFTKGVTEKGKTSFSRDNDIKYSDSRSYKIENKEYTDSIFYEKIKVLPDTPYKVTCMVKTQNVENENNSPTGGAQIALKDTTECSRNITGNTEWTQLVFMFNSKNNTEVEIAFRLGGYADKSKGIAWFSDFKIEEGNIDTDNKWNFACFIIENTDVNINRNGKIENLKFKMSYGDISDIESDIKRLPSTIKTLSNNKINIEYETIKIKEPLKSVSYDEEFEYYISQNDIDPVIRKYVENKEYDYIYIVARLGDINNKNKVLVHDWIGLGGMDYYGIGYSNIRLPDSDKSYEYKYHSNINTFPEEVFLHEFLHTLERNEKEYGNENIANLHDYEKYGYKEEKLDGLKKWYEAYMNNTINDGLNHNAYKSKPIHESNFKFSYELDEFREPRNLIEHIYNLINRTKNILEK